MKKSPCDFQLPKEEFEKARGVSWPVPEKVNLLE